MKTFLISILVICLALSLYSFVFNNGEALSFEQVYKNAMNYILDLGEAFNSFKDGLVNLITGKLTFNDILKIAGEVSADIIRGVTNALKTLYTDLINGFGQFFVELWTNIANFFGQCGHGGGECPESCVCKCKECL